jgi:hypothetical protein
MVVRQIIQIANDDERLNAYTEFESKSIFFRWGNTQSKNLVVISPKEANQVANWLLQQTAEIEKRG